MSHEHPPIVLASSSKYRRELLQKIGLPFISHSPDINEEAQDNESALHLVERLACEKAAALAERFPQHIIIGSDQVAVLNQPDGHTHILGKPGNHANAYRQLKACSGQVVTFYTGLCVLNTSTNARDSLVSPFEVGFRSLSDDEIHGYIEREQPFDCAGSFKSEGLGIALFKYLRGDDPNSLIGLPLIELLAILRRQYNINPLT